jgi:putative oxidoreductase
MSETQCPMNCAAKGYDWAAQKIDLLQPIFLLLVRLYIGYEAMISGWAHLHHVKDTADFFRSLGIPFPELNVYLSAITEVVGGALLFVGLASRLVAIPFTGNFIVALLSVNLADPKYREMLKNILDNQDVVLKDDAFPFLFVGIIVLIFGPGKISLDALLKRLMCQKGASPPPGQQGAKV